MRPAGRKTESSLPAEMGIYLEVGHPKGRDPAGEDTSLIFQVLGVDEENTYGKMITQSRKWNWSQQNTCTLLGVFAMSLSQHNRGRS